MTNPGQSSNACDLCGDALEGRGATRSFGLDLCEHCFQGDVFARVAPRGFVLDEQRRTEERIHGDSRHGTRTLYITELTGSVPRRIGLAGKFTREKLGHKLVKIFKREIQVGDPLFDDMVYVSETADERNLAEYLANEGVQSAIMEFLATGAMGGTTKCAVEIAGNSITARVEDWEGFDESPGSPYRRSIIALLHYLERFADGK
jgi:hypothetical protein